MVVVVALTADTVNARDGRRDDFKVTSIGIDAAAEPADDVWVTFAAAASEKEDGLARLGNGGCGGSGSLGSVNLDRT